MECGNDELRRDRRAVVRMPLEIILAEDCTNKLEVMTFNNKSDASTCFRERSLVRKDE